jgi:hypothetical protein
LDPEKLLEILEAGDFDQLVGLVEDDRFEAKSQPYELTKERGKAELASKREKFVANQA